MLQVVRLAGCLPALLVQLRSEKMKMGLLIITVSMAYALFIVCPRVVGLAQVLSRTKEVNLYIIITLGTILVIPLMLLLLFLLKKFGAVYALAFAIITDILAALWMGSYSWKSTVSLLIISSFVWLGIFTSNLVTGRMSLEKNIPGEGVRKMKIDENTTLSEILKIEGAEKILSTHQLPCLHCPMAGIEMGSLRIGEICRMYGIDTNRLLGDLNNLVAKASQ